MSQRNNAAANDGKVVLSVAVALLLVTWFYYLEAYGVVLGAVYGVGAVELFNRTSTGRRVKALLRGSKEK